MTDKILSECHEAELMDANTYYIQKSTTNWMVCSACGDPVNFDGSTPKDAA